MNFENLKKAPKRFSFKKIFAKNSNRGEFDPPPVPFYRLKNQNGVFDEFYKIFVKFGLEN